MRSEFVGDGKAINVEHMDGDNGVRLVFLGPVRGSRFQGKLFLETATSFINI
jgi:hypothetical protein